MSNNESDGKGIDPSRINAIRAETESDRSPELKAARESYVQTTNDFLKSVKQMQAAGEMITVGNFTFPIEDTPRVTERRLGPNPLRPRLHMVQVNHLPGISLHGDGETSPLVFSAVIPGSADTKRTIQIIGTDPLIPRNEDGAVTYGIHDRSDVAKAEFDTTFDLGEDGAFQDVLSYAVRANGQMQYPNQRNRYGDNPRVEGMQEADMMIRMLASELNIPPAPTV